MLTLIAALSLAGAQDDAKLPDLLEQMSAAIAAGAFAEASEMAYEAFSEIEASACPYRPEAAITAVIAALQAAPREEGFYLRWAARRVEAALGDILPAGLSAYADTAPGPGRSIDTDHLFLASPYRLEFDGEADCPGEALIGDRIFYADPSASEVLLLIADFERRDERGSRITRFSRVNPPSRRAISGLSSLGQAKLLWGYPRSEAQAFFERAASSGLYTQFEGVALVQVDDCWAVQRTVSDYEAVCRDGVTPQ